MARFLLMVVAVGAGALVARADDKPVPAADLDKRAYRAAYDTAAAGTKMFNAGDQAGCLRLYEGSLATLATLLEHRPDLAKAIRDRMAEADKQGAVGDKAFTLRKALDAVMEQTGKGVANAKPLWERLGGEAAVTKVVDDFVAAAGGDKEVNFFRDGKYPSDDKAVARLKRSLVEMVSAGTGGPLKYTGRDMKTAHAGMKITRKEFDKLAGHLKAALEKNKVGKAEADELMKAVGETATAIVEEK